ncbi:hypothetical protein HanHA300_Chr17g0665351 [Helianthus annuus]|nr:hypothetical protein HanHA300_Chr17g0665351 [Helianthus annuus]KAJ0815959.1 hypothetical protein HanLR1_Chr00c0611g0763901 [Helianthus annuus]
MNIAIVNEAILTRGLPPMEGMEFLMDGSGGLAPAWCTSTCIWSISCSIGSYSQLQIWLTLS